MNIKEKITRVSHRDALCAEQIYNVFQASYIVEAKLIGVDDFPPLRRSAQDIAESDNYFLGLYCGQELAAVLEYSSLPETTLSIDSVVVHPAFFRRAYASRLLHHLLDATDARQVVVETAAVNAPAIGLYQKAGFVPTREFTPAHGISKIELRLALEH